MPGTGPARAVAPVGWPAMLKVDGSIGEGGGQVLRTALSLSMVTRTPVNIVNVRARRPRPGLRPQHLAAVEAAAAICDGAVEGATKGSTEVFFVPGRIKPGDYEFAIYDGPGNTRSAGSTVLVLQTLLPALWSADTPSTVAVEGGTHNPMAPPFEFLERAFLPVVARMGQRATVALERHGFVPRGNGRIEARIEPGPWRPIELHERGRLVRRGASALLKHLPGHIAARELEIVRKRLGWPRACLEQVEIESDTHTGNVLLLEIEHEHVTEIVTAFGRQGVPAERVAGGAAREMKRYLKSKVPVGEHLADQLMLPMALAGGGSFTTTRLSSHAATNLEVIRAFLDVEFDVTPLAPGVLRLAIKRADAS